MSGVGNILRGVWVVLKLEWQPLHQGAPLLNLAGFGQVLDQPHPLLFLLFSPYGGAEDFCFSFSPITILASAAVRGFSASCSAPSPPSSPLPQRHLSSRIQHERFAYFRFFISRNVSLNIAWQQALRLPNTFLVILLKL